MAMSVDQLIELLDQTVERNDEEDYVYILGGPPIEKRSDEAPWHAGFS
jgi:hypothetical protein